MAVPVVDRIEMVKGNEMQLGDKIKCDWGNKVFCIVALWVQHPPS
jgi:hypothetical protein